MPSFPLMRDLPSVVNTAGWTWDSFEAPIAPCSNFWLGKDPQGNRWLTKLRGDFRAYREIVFSRLAQQMGWSCQSSVFMQLDRESAEALGKKQGEIHAAHWFLDEHVSSPCTEDCSLLSLRGKEIETIEDVVSLPFAHIIDWPKSEMAACLFGGHEPPGRFFTKMHEFVIIDSELMFSSGPQSFESTRWWGKRDTPQLSGLELANQVCADFVALGRESLSKALAVPEAISIQQRQPIAPLIYESFAHAEAFLRGK